MFNRDTFRLIKRTKKRFITLFLMVMIGVAFMVGLMSTSSIMQRSVDVYFDQNNLMDIQIYSNYGFCEDDIEAFRNTRTVKDVVGSKFYDAYVLDEHDDLYVTRFEEIDTNINQFELIDGRMPENESEAIALEISSFGAYFKIGDMISVSNENVNPEDHLLHRQYKIVGTFKSPKYLSSTNETSTLDNLSLDTVVMVGNENFVSDYYTTVYLTVEGADGYEAFTDEYQELIDKSMISIRKTKEKQEPYLKNTIIEEATAKINDGEAELETKKAEAMAELDKAQKELDDAYIKICIGETQIETNEKTIEAGIKEIETNEAILNSNASTVNNAIAEVEKQGNDSFDNIYQKAESAYYLYIALEAQNTVDSTEIEKQNIEYQKEIDANNAEILELEELNKTLDEELDSEKIAQNNIRINELKNSNLILEAKIEANNLKLNDTIDSILQKMDEEANGSVKETYYNLKKLKEGKEQIAEGYKQLNSAKVELDVGKKQLEEAKKEIANGKAQYNSGVKQLEEAKYEMDIEIEKAENELAKARQDLSELPDSEWMILDRDSHYSSYMFKNSVIQMRDIGFIFPLLFFLVAALVCLTTMTRLIDEERSQIGVFSALGFSKNKIISKYLIYAGTASILGSVIGIVIGIALFPTVIYSVWRLMYDLPDIKPYLPLRYALVGTLSFTSLMLVVTYYVARRELKEQPSTLMRPKPPKNAKEVFLEKITWLWKRLSFSSKITARNLIRYKSRFFMTVIGVAGCAGLLVAGFGIKDSIGDIIRVQYGEVFKYNNTINLESDYYLNDVIEKLNADSNNEQVVSFMDYSTKVYLENGEKTITVHVYDDRQIGRVMDLRNRHTGEKLDIHGDGVVISEKFAKTNGISVGDTITIESKNGIKSEVLIDGICEIYFQHYMFMSDELYEESFNETVHHDKIAVTAIDSNEMKSSISECEGIVSIVDFKPMVENFEHMIDALDIIILVIILSSGSLAFVVLMNLSEVNISERMREIATLKVLGFNNREVNSYIFKEIFLLTIIGGLIGMPLGKIEHRIIMEVINMDMVMFGSNIKTISYIYSFGITIIFTCIVLLIMSKSLRKIEMVESLKSVE